jgi:argininosuccinate lyase
MNFRTAHEIVTEAVKKQDGIFDPDKMAAEVTSIMAERYREFKVPEIELLRESLDAARFVAVRKIPGGPAPEALEPEIKRSEELLDTDAQWLKKLMAVFEDAKTFVRTETETFLATVDTATTSGRPTSRDHQY